MSRRPQRTPNWDLIRSLSIGAKMYPNSEPVSPERMKELERMAKELASQPKKKPK